MIYVGRQQGAGEREREQGASVKRASRGEAIHNRSSRSHSRLVCHLKGHRARGRGPGQATNPIPVQAQSTELATGVQMTYKNLIFNNTNQFKNHQRHKNSFAGA